jgi:hypothetical protein
VTSRHQISSDNQKPVAIVTGAGGGIGAAELARRFRIDWRAMDFTYVP